MTALRKPQILHPFQKPLSAFPENVAIQVKHSKKDLKKGFLKVD